MPKQTTRRKDFAAQKKVEQMLQRLVVRQGGHIVSATGSRNLTVEIPAGSDLPTRLSGLGFCVRYTDDTANIIEIRL